MSGDQKGSRLLRRLVLVAVLIVALPQVALAENSVVIESRTFSADQPNCSVGVFLTNDVQVLVVGLALELRSISGAAYIAPVPYPASSVITIQPESRMDHSPLGREYVCDPPNIAIRVSEEPAGEECSGPISHSWHNSVDTLTGTSPDGILFVSSHYDDCGPWALGMPEGSDPIDRTKASILLKFKVNPNAGCFEIDTACFFPVLGGLINIHTLFVDYVSTIVPVAFTKATICIDPDCFHCYCQGDSYDCDAGWIDVIDVVRAINVSFRGEAPTTDPSPACPYMRTDINCDGATDLRDIVGIIDVAFNNQPESVAFCNPCP